MEGLKAASMGVLGVVRFGVNFCNAFWAGIGEGFDDWLVGEGVEEPDDRTFAELAPAAAWAASGAVVVAGLAGLLVGRRR